MRKLASIQVVNGIFSIDGADRIEVAQVLGWQVVVKKDEFHIGDKCIYFEIDSFLPICPEFEFLRNSSYKNSDLLGEGFRLRTQILRGQLSQGLCLPTSLFPETANLEEGEDVTELLGVRKWEIPETASSDGTIIGNLPWFISRSDETRIQVVPDILSEFGNHAYYISTKMDGASHAIGIDEKNNIYVCGHSYQYKDDEKSSFYRFVKRRGFLDKLVGYKNSIGAKQISVIGEFCGPGMQKKRLKLSKPEWYVFTVEINGKRVALKTAMKTVRAIGANFVPIEEIGGNLKNKYHDVNAMLRRAEDNYYQSGLPKEGIVIRPLEPVTSTLLNAPLSFKVINNQYLLKAK